MAFAADAILSWEPNTESDLAGYRVHYGPAPGSYPTMIDVGLITTYTVTGLAPGTYYFVLTAYNTAGVESAFSNEVSKVIADMTPPVISAVAATSLTSTSATITWTTDEPATALVEYGTSTGYGLQTTETISVETAHNQVLTGLQASTTYHFRVLSRDAADNLAGSGDRTFTTPTPTDTTLPVISNVTVSNVTTSSATISWTTNEAATTQVQYGTTAAYGSTTSLNSSLVAAHSQALSGLLASTPYHFRVLSRDAAGNLATSGDFMVTTLAATTTSATVDATPPVISGLTVSNLTSTSAVITWNTNEPATSQVEYGTTTAYGSLSGNTTLVQSHSQSLAGLTRGTTYHFRVRSIDAAGNTSVSADQTFRTPRGHSYGRR